MRKIVIHIGAPKTASTTLQKCLFAKHNELHFFGEDGAGCVNANDREIINSMVFDDDFHFPYDECARLFQAHSGLEPQKTLIYSNGDVMTGRVPTLCARRLHSFLPDAEILLVIRNQFTAIPSFYANHGVYLKPAPPYHFQRYVSFDDWMRFCTIFIKYGPLTCYFYNTTLKLYSDLFGKDKIHILLFEEFIQEQKTFVRKLCHILDIEPLDAFRLIMGGHERKRNTGRMLRYHRFRSSFFWKVPLSRYFPGGHLISSMLWRFLKSGSPANVPVPNDWRNKIIELYKDGNTKIAKEYHLPLKEHGYPVE